MRYLFDFVAVGFIYVKWIYPRWKNIDKEQFVVNNLMFIYLVFVAYFTMMPVIAHLPYLFASSYSTMNFVPFIDLEYHRPKAVQEIILNIIMLVPFGVLYPLMKKKNIIEVVGTAMILSLSIELIQPLINSSRSFDVTDIITNTFGAFVGYLLYLLFKNPLKIIVKMLATLGFH